MGLLEHRSSIRAIETAADTLIKEHGHKAVSEAARQVSALNSKGLFALAGTWQQIRQKIIKKQRMRQIY